MNATCLAINFGGINNLKPNQNELHTESTLKSSYLTDITLAPKIEINNFSK